MSHQDDPAKFRVTLICRGGGDYAEGYGPTPEKAREAVLRYWKRDGHKMRDIHSEHLERTVETEGGAAHYEPIEESNHLSEEYHKALCRIGARVAVLALKKPDLFRGRPVDCAPPRE